MSSALTSTRLPAISEDRPLTPAPTKYLTKEQREAMDKAAAAFIKTLEGKHDKLEAQKAKMSDLKREK